MMFVSHSEQGANRLGEVANLFSLCAIFLLALLNTLGVLEVDVHLVVPALLLETALALPAVVVSRATRRKAPCLRYLHLSAALLFPTVTVSLDGFAYSMAFVIPIGLSCCYLDRKILWGTFASIFILLLGAAVANACWGMPDVTMIDLPSDALVPWRHDIEHVMEEIGYDRMIYLANVLRFQYLPNVVFLVVCLILADGAICAARTRAQMADAFSKGLLDSIGKRGGA